MSSTAKTWLRPDITTFRTGIHLSRIRSLVLPRWVWLACVALLSAILIMLHRPDAVTRPQLWAEDGGVFYAQAYNLGGFQAIVIPVAGYIMLLQRIVALVALLLPIMWVPTAFVVAGIAMQVAPLVFWFSRRLDTMVPNTGVRGLLAFLYIAYPNAFYMSDSITNAQWFLIVLMFLIVIAPPPTTRAWRCFDVVTLAVTGLSAPLCLFLAPVVFLRWRESRSSWTLLLLKITVMTAVIQAVTVGLTGTILAGLLPPTPIRVPHTLGATPDNLIHLLSGQVVLGSVLGARGFGVVFETRIWAGLAFPLLVVAGATALSLLAVREAPSSVRLFLLLGALILAGSLIMPLTGQSPTDPGSAWAYMAEPGHDPRYTFVLGLAWLTVVVWLCAQNSRRWLRRAGTVLLALVLLVGIPMSWSVPAVPDKHFAAYVARFEQLRPGQSITIPLPPAWKMTLTKH